MLAIYYLMVWIYYFMPPIYHLVTLLYYLVASIYYRFASIYYLVGLKILFCDFGIFSCHFDIYINSRPHLIKKITTMSSQRLCILQIQGKTFFLYTWQHKWPLWRSLNVYFADSSLLSSFVSSIFTPTFIGQEHFYFEWIITVLQK